MNLEYILLTALISSVACVGMYISQEEGYILHFMRSWLLRHREAEEQITLHAIQDLKDAEIDMYKANNDLIVKKYEEEFSESSVCSPWPEHISEEKTRLNEVTRQSYEILIDDCDKSFERKMAYQKLFKPISLCITCFASFWGSICFISIWGISFDLLPFLILNIFLTAPLNDFLYSIYSKKVLR